jgi:hypothetical protein
LAVKSYSEENADVFRTEKKNFSGIGTLEGVVKCFGWYDIQEADGSEKTRTTHNILLEYGDQDLDEYLALRYPPVLNSEIISFWKSIFALATTLKHIHNFEYPGPGQHLTKFDG